jgi:hypothetical protein
MVNRAPSRPTQAVILAVWQAEDGRCEACKRPMDKRLARVTRLDDHAPRTVENLQLVCLDCKARRPDPLVRLSLAPAVIERVLGQLAPELVEQGTRWLRSQLRRYGVLVWANRERRKYWLPGMGAFEVLVQPDGAAVVDAVSQISATPELKVKPQAQTRGLPRPDRRPLPASAKTATAPV